MQTAPSRGVSSQEREAITSNSQSGQACLCFCLQWKSLLGERRVSIKAVLWQNYTSYTNYTIKLWLYMALMLLCRANFCTNTASACGQPSSRGSKSRLLTLRSCRLNRNNGVQHFLSSDMKLSAVGLWQEVFFLLSPNWRDCYAHLACYLSTLAGLKPHAGLSCAISFSRGREQLEQLDTSQGEASG